MVFPFVTFCRQHWTVRFSWTFRLRCRRCQAAAAVASMRAQLEQEEQQVKQVLQDLIQQLMEETIR